MDTTKIEWAIKDSSGSYLAFKLLSGQEVFSQPEFAVENCIKDLRQLYRLNPDTTGMNLNVIFPNG
jgi:hypothetical protein